MIFNPYRDELTPGSATSLLADLEAGTGTWEERCQLAAAVWCHFPYYVRSERSLLWWDAILTGLGQFVVTPGDGARKRVVRVRFDSDRFEPLYRASTFAARGGWYWLPKAQGGAYWDPDSPGCSLWTAKPIYVYFASEGFEAPSGDWRTQVVMQPDPSGIRLAPENFIEAERQRWRQYPKPNAASVDTATGAGVFPSQSWAGSRAQAVIDAHESQRRAQA